ncbi:MAG: hypothetical protein ACXADH_04720 [Candidatus Kariarchaeaceae archaeon]|jgi:hypothetical protein
MYWYPNNRIVQKQKIISLHNYAKDDPQPAGVAAGGSNEGGAVPVDMKGM